MLNTRRTVLLATIAVALCSWNDAGAQQTTVGDTYQAIAANHSDRLEGGRIRGNTMRRLEAAISAQAINQISRQPGEIAEIMRAATAAAPEIADAVTQNAARAFPGYAARIYAATGRTAPAGTIAVADPVSTTTTYGTAPAFRPGLSPRQDSSRRTRRAAIASSTLIAAIASNPAQIGPAVQQAVASAPEAKDAVLSDAVRAFPGYEAQIKQAAGTVTASPPATAVDATSPQPQTTGAPVPVSRQQSPQPAARQAAPREETWDPIEPVNRAILTFNDVVDTVILRPIAWTYNKVTPDPVILAVRRFFLNLKSPVILANDLAQFTLHDAAVTVGRFGINSTLGLAGFFDPATGFGLPRHVADFGQTMHSYGSGPGPYLVLPILGPSTVRDGLGSVVDIFFDPLTYLLPTVPALARTGANAIVIREELLEPLDELRTSSIDYYGALQSAFYQTRAVQLGKSPGGVGASMDSESVDALFDETN